MTIHQNLESMLHESLLEMLLAAKYCIEYQKDPKIWSASGCYGFPAALLLLSIVDSIGSYVEQGNVENHFKILNHQDYYGLDLSSKEIRIIYDKYRNLLSHNSLIAPNLALAIGISEEQLITQKEGIYCLHLVPFFHLCVKAVSNFLGDAEILQNNNTILNIYQK